MGIAVLVFSVVVGFFHFQGSTPAPVDSRALAGEPEVPVSYGGVHHQSETAAQSGLTQPSSGSSEAAAFSAEGGPGNNQDLAQIVADEVAANPPGAASVMAASLSRMDDNATLGDVATLAAAATRAAPGEAPAIAGALTRSLKDRGDAVLAATVATIVSLVPEQSRDIGLVVGAIVGEDVEALGMIAQTVAIATGEATFSSLSEASGVSVAELMRASFRFGSAVPFDVPAYAAQLAPGPSRVAEGAKPMPAVDNRIDDPVHSPTETEM